MSATSSAGLRDFLSALPETPISPEFLQSCAGDSAGVPTTATSTTTTTTATATAGADSTANWDDLIKLTNTLHLFKRHLNIEAPIQLDGIAKSLQLVSQASSLRSNKQTTISDTTTEVPAQDSGAMDVVSETVKTETAQQNDEEAEFGDTDHTTGAVVPSASEVSVELTEESKLALAEADLDRIQLRMMKHLLRELRDVLDIVDPADASNNGKGKGGAMSRCVATRLPLNQLTWAELARMSILNHLYQEQGHERENIQHVLRGAKASHFRLSKNVIRNIRYRLAVQTKRPALTTTTESESMEVVKCENEHCTSSLCDRSGAPLQYLGTPVSPENRLTCLAVTKQEPHSTTTAVIDNATLMTFQQRINYQNGLFQSEKEIIQSLEQLTTGTIEGEYAGRVYSETYKRCARVLSRLLGLNQSRNLIWEVDASLYPDYYTTIVRPVMYTGIAASLLNQQYSFPDCTDKNVDEDTLVAALFASDLMQVPINCISYNSEITPVVAQAQKMILASHRMLTCWLYSSSRPPLTMLGETFCLLTQEYIVNTDALKCGKCTGFYCHSALDDLGDSTTATQNGDSNKLGVEYSTYYIPPTQEIVDQVNEEWVCPLCLCEDTSILESGLHSNSIQAMYTTPWCIDEWGPSCKVPWLLNPTHTTMHTSIEKDLPFLSPFVRALHVLSRTDTSSVLPIAVGSTHIINPSLLRSHKQQTLNNKSAPEIGNIKLKAWSVNERITVLLALAVVFRSSDKSMEFMQGINADCEKLIKISAKANFREADFMSVVKVGFICIYLSIFLGFICTIGIIIWVLFV